MSSFRRFLPLVALVWGVAGQTQQYDVLIPFDDPHVLTSGRMIPRPDLNGSIFDWQNAGASVSVVGATAVFATITQTNPAGTVAPAANKLVVYVFAGKQLDRVATLLTAPGTFNYTLVAGLSVAVTYTVKFIKVSEPSFNEGTTHYPEWLIFHGFVTDGLAVDTLIPTGRRLEFVGDSQTAGYGVDSVGPCGAARYNSGWDYSWASLLCTNFSADCNTNAWSGKGLYINNGNGYYAPTMPEIYRWNTGSDDSQGLWNFTRYLPDAVVVNLGGNDYSTPQSHLPGFDANFTRTYVDFFTNLTSVYYTNTTVLFAAVGPLIPLNYNATLAAVAAAQALGMNVHLLDLRGALDCANCVGCAGHPGIAGYEAMYALARDAIATVMGW